MERTRIQLADGVYLTYLPARKFKTSLLSAQFVTPLQQETASAYALLPAILRRGTVRYPDLGALSARLDRLYGASVDYTVRKQGENQCVGFVASFIDDNIENSIWSEMDESGLHLSEKKLANLFHRNSFSS